MQSPNPAHNHAERKTFPPSNVSNPRYLRFLYALIEGEIAAASVGEEDRAAAEELRIRIFGAPKVMAAGA